VDFRAWLRGLARERRLKFLRDHLDAQCRSARRQQALPDESWRHPSSPGGRPRRGAGAPEQSDRPGRARRPPPAEGPEGRRLRAEDQEVIRLRVTEGRTNPEVAGLLGTTPAAVAKRLERALRRLREAVEGAQGADP